MIAAKVIEINDRSYKSDQLQVTVEEIWPLKAMEYLNTQKTQRKVKKRWVKELAERMKNDLWDLSNDAIAFNKAGAMINGQHRMMAIVQSGRSEKFLVVRGYDPDAIHSMDTGQGRSVKDVITLDGKEASTIEIAILRALFWEPGAIDAPRLDNKEWLDYFNLYREAVQFAANKHGNNLSVMYAPIRAVVARAWFSQNKEELARFLHILDNGTGDGTPEGRLPLLLRSMYVDARAKRSTGSYDKRNEVFCASIYCLDRFLNKDPKERLRRADKQLFFIPGFDD